MPKVATIKLEADVADVIRRSKIDGFELTLPEQLDRDLYMRVDKILRAAGGKWNRSARSHCFPTKPLECIGEALEMGEILDVKRTFQSFYTPPVLAAQMAEWLDPQPGLRYLEPSAGEGALVKAVLARESSAVVFAVEIREELIPGLVMAGAREGIASDFLELRDPDYEGTGSRELATFLRADFDGIIANPPFTAGQDVAHVTHALKFLRPGGKLVAVMSPAWERGKGRKAQEFRELLEAESKCYEWVLLPEKTFVESGTDVRCGLLTLTKDE